MYDDNLSQDDFANLDFLIELDAQGLQAWLDAADNDDLVYALEILRPLITNLALKELAIMDLVTNTDLADGVLNRIRKLK
jgi:hypothetical protein